MKKIILIICIFLTLNSCTQDSKWKQNKFAEEVCECFEKIEQGNIDERLEPCLSKPINENFKEIQQEIYPDKTTEDAISDYMMDIMVEMIRDCDKFYNELNLKYTNFYPEIKFDSIKNSIVELNDSISSNSTVDSIKVRLLHKRISLFTKAREFEKALEDIDKLSLEFKLEKETYFVSAYIYMIQEKYDTALEKIDLAIKYDNPNYILYKELIERRKNGR